MTALSNTTSWRSWRLPELACEQSIITLGVSPADMKTMDHSERIGDAKTALLVDDNDELRDAVREYLEEEGYAVTTAAEAEAALHATPDCATTGEPIAASGRRCAATHPTTYE